jgi:hypothetical protein
MRFDATTPRRDGEERRKARVRDDQKLDGGRVLGVETSALPVPAEPGGAPRCRLPHRSLAFTGVSWGPLDGVVPQQNAV